MKASRAPAASRWSLGHAGDIDIGLERRLIPDHDSYLAGAFRMVTDAFEVHDHIRVRR